MMANELPAPQSNVLIYQAEGGETRITVRLEDETAWLTQADMATLYQTTKQNVSLHLRNVFESRELSENQVVKQSLTTAADGKRIGDASPLHSGCVGEQKTKRK